MISCEQYDYIEIVCLYHYPIKLTLKRGGEISGVAQDTARNVNNNECIKVTIEGSEQLVVLDDIASLAVCVDNPHFNSVSFI